MRAVLDWCSVFARRGHKVRLFVYEPNDIPADWLKNLPGLPHAVVLPVPFGPGKLLTKAALTIVDDAIADTDVLHLNAPWLDGNRQLAAACAAAARAVHGHHPRHARRVVDEPARPRKNGCT